VYICSQVVLVEVTEGVYRLCEQFYFKRTEADPVSETPCYLVILDFRTLDKVQKPISSQILIFVMETLHVFCEVGTELFKCFLMTLIFEITSKKAFSLLLLFLLIISFRPGSCLGRPKGYYSGDQMKKNEMSGPCSTYGK
jgi:hypothetical protein